VRSTASEDWRHCGIDSHRPVLPASYASLLLRAGTSVALAIPLLVSGPGWMRVAAAALTGGSLVAVALSYAVGLLAFAEAGGNPDAARNLVRTIGIDAPQRRLGLS
jgi:hypothetical protein